MHSFDAQREALVAHWISDDRSFLVVRVGDCAGKEWRSSPPPGGATARQRPASAG
jgi:hypothetical protein